MNKDKIKDELDNAENKLSSIVKEVEQKVAPEKEKIENKVKNMNNSTKRKWLEYFVYAISITIIVLFFYRAIR